MKAAYFQQQDAYFEDLQSRLEELDFDSEEDAQEIDEILCEMKTSREDYLRDRSIQEMCPSDALAASIVWQSEYDEQEKDCPDEPPSDNAPS